MSSVHYLIKTRFPTRGIYDGKQRQLIPGSLPSYAVPISDFDSDHRTGGMRHRSRTPRRQTTRGPRLAAAVVLGDRDKDHWRNWSKN